MAFLSDGKDLVMGLIGHSLEMVSQDVVKFQDKFDDSNFLSDHVKQTK